MIFERLPAVPKKFMNKKISIFNDALVMKRLNFKNMQVSIFAHAYFSFARD